MRKYAYLMPAFKRNGITHLIVIGGANSNNVLAACILCREYAIEPIPLVKKVHAEGTNQALLHLVVDRSQWVMLDAEKWPSAEAYASQLVEEYDQRQWKATYLPEGATLPLAMLGAATLAEDIHQHEQELGMDFEDIFIDAGTGLSAAGLYCKMVELDIHGRLHVTSLADEPEILWGRINSYLKWYAPLTGSPPPVIDDRLVLHRPVTAASFGSINAEVVAAIKGFARRGVFTDPIYSAKHLLTVERWLNAQERMPPRLIIHSGGAQALPGYVHALAGK